MLVGAAAHGALICGARPAPQRVPKCCGAAVEAPPTRSSPTPALPRPVQSLCLGPDAPPHTPVLVSLSCLPASSRSRPRHVCAGINNHGSSPIRHQRLAGLVHTSRLYSMICAAGLAMCLRAVCLPPCCCHCCLCQKCSCAATVMLLNLWRQTLPLLCLSRLAITVVSIPVSAISVLSHLTLVTLPPLPPRFLRYCFSLQIMLMDGLPPPGCESRMNSAGRLDPSPRCHNSRLILWRGEVTVLAA
ncbi:hypothetical protein E2C01_029041 [Portunus trituberculatus]|uniref:Uncharacterized protein n=1 Tax=Portunus trituberculatus TaxID=210409 RepID=A0A5B7EQG4_PORTR|nr:hypothetical protein [Portunus trituberculatus]